MQLKPLPTYYTLRVVYGLMFSLMAAVSTIYRVDVVGLNPFQLVLVGTTLEAAYFLGEIPTGVVADAYSRKLSLIIGYLLIGLGFFVEGSIPAFWGVLLAQVIWGVGATFTSGAEAAWLAGEIGESKLQHTMIRGGQIGRIVAIVGVLAAMFTGSFNLGLAFRIAGLGIFLLGIVLIFVMPETGFRPAAAAERETWGKLKQTFRAGLAEVRASRLLLLIFAVEVCFGLASEGIDRLSEAHLLEDFVWPTVVDWQPIVWLGLISIANLLISIAVTEWLRRTVPEDDSTRIIRAMRLINALFIVAVVAYAFANSFMLGVITYTFLQQIRHANGALYGPWVAKQISAEVRATVLSMWGQMNAVGQMIGGPLIGAVALATTLPLGYASIGVLLLPIPILFTAISLWQQRTLELK